MYCGLARLQHQIRFSRPSRKTKSSRRSRMEEVVVEVMVMEVVVGVVAVAWGQ